MAGEKFKVVTTDGVTRSAHKTAEEAKSNAEEANNSAEELGIKTRYRVKIVG